MCMAGFRGPDDSHTTSQQADWASPLPILSVGAAPPPPYNPSMRMVRLLLVAIATASLWGNASEVWLLRIDDEIGSSCRGQTRDASPRQLADLMRREPDTQFLG